MVDFNVLNARSSHFVVNVIERQWLSKTKIHENRFFEILISPTNNY